MSWGDAQARLGKLRELCKVLAEGGRERVDELIELAGALFDEGFLDGQQYAAIHDLDEALRAGAPDVCARAETCAAMI